MLLDTRGSTARVANLEEVVAPPEIKPPGEEFDELGRIWYDTCCGRSRFTNSSKRAGNASGKSKTDLARPMHSNGEPASTIAAALGVSRATIYRVLTVDAETADQGAGFVVLRKNGGTPLSNSRSTF